VRRAAATALAGVALTLSALTFDASPLLVVGVAFAALGVVLPAWIGIAARRARLTRRLSCDRVVEDEPLEATIEVGHGILGLPGGEVHDPLVGSPVSVRETLPLLAGGGAVCVQVVARFPRRGLKHLDPPSLTLRDTLGLSSILRAGTGPAQQLLVLPRVDRVNWVAGDPAERLDPSGGPAVPEALAAAEVDGLRPYRPGTPASRIHWPALARGAGLLERRLRADSDGRPLVVLDARCPGLPEHLDAAVRAAASLVVALARRGGCGLLLPGDRRPVEIDPELTGWPAAHARLAIVENGDRNRAPALAPGARLGQIFYVAAARLSQLPATLLASGHRRGVVVLPVGVFETIPRAASFTVAGCVGLALGPGRRISMRERVA
jgi:uncharacterized protein (DUF58 family)